MDSVFCYSKMTGITRVLVTVASSSDVLSPCQVATTRGPFFGFSRGPADKLSGLCVQNELGAGRDVEGLT